MSKMKPDFHSRTRTLWKVLPSPDGVEFSSSFIRKGFLHLHFNLLTPRSLPENEDGQLCRHHSSSNGEWSWVEHHA